MWDFQILQLYVGYTCPVYSTSHDLYLSFKHKIGVTKLILYKTSRLYKRRLSIGFNRKDRHAAYAEHSYITKSCENLDREMKYS